MIKRRFYKLEHGDRDAPSQSSSSSDSEFEAEETEDEQEEEEEEEEEQDDSDVKEEDDGVARLTGGNESSSGMFNLMICICSLPVLFADSLLLRGISRNGNSLKLLFEILIRETLLGIFRQFLILDSIQHA